MKKLFLIPVLLSASAFAGVLTFDVTGLKAASDLPSSQDAPVYNFHAPQVCFAQKKQQLKDVKHLLFFEQFLRGYDQDKNLVFEFDLSTVSKCVSSIYKSLGNDNYQSAEIDEPITKINILCGIKKNLFYGTSPDELNFNPITVNFQNVINRVQEINMVSNQYTDFNFNGTFRIPLKIKLGKDSCSLFPYALRTDEKSAKSNVLICNENALVKKVNFGKDESFSLQEKESQQLFGLKNTQFSLQKAYGYANYKSDEKFAAEFETKQNQAMQEQQNLCAKERELENTIRLIDQKTVKVRQEKALVLEMINREKSLDTATQMICKLNDQLEEEQQILQTLRSDEQEITQKIKKIATDAKERGLLPYTTGIFGAYAGIVLTLGIAAYQIFMGI